MAPTELDKEIEAAVVRVNEARVKNKEGVIDSNLQAIATEQRSLRTRIQAEVERSALLIAGYRKNIELAQKNAEPMDVKEIMGR